MIFAGSGHRSRSLGTDFPPRQLLLVEFAQTVIRKFEPTHILSGMALGWDQALARAARREGVPYDAVIPFEGQERWWPSTDRAAYKDLLNDAAGVQIVDTGEMPVRAALMARNEAMVDQADAVLGLWDGRDWGGTFQCLKYAHDRKVRVHQLYQDWQTFSA